MARAGEGEGRGAGSGIDGQRRRHGVVAERSSGGGVRRSRGSAAVQAGAQQGGAIMAEAASRLRAGRAGRGVISSALRKQGSIAEEEERRERERVDFDFFLKFFNGSSKKFEYESCSKFKILKLSFQAFFSLKLHLKVKI